MSGTEDYYGILEISRGASQEEIRRAYKRLAVRWHPDKNPQQRDYAESRFKAVAEAYETLGDPQKRRNYDAYGHGGGHQRSRGRATHDPFDLFNAFFGGRDPFESFMRPMGRQGFATDPFGDSDPFGHGGFGFGGMMGMMNDMERMGGGMGGSSFMSSMSSMGGGGGMSKSVTQQTVIKNGKKVTRTVTRTTQPDGTVHEDVEESVDDQPTARRVTGGGSSRSRQRLN
eukprot:TRINITY_DN36990_c0_g1_i1.p1 TRINITY_DN36990_c0_g1~~TRINITY_DN36990_c0_g1_i1.p1  ORF type:complete len:228 (+),score=27.43 TRINITY_DN36990_c0_g1_i1:45-728(+)